MNLDELHDIINEIKLKPKSFDLDSINKEIKNIQFKMYCRQQIHNNIKDWINKNPFHTFPKKQQRWINTIRSHRNLICIKYNCDIKELLLSIKNNKPIPDYMKGLSYYVYDAIQYGEHSDKLLSNSDKHIIVYGDANDAYHHLFDCGMLYKASKYSRIHIQKYSLFEHGFKKEKRERKEEDNIEYIISSTKRKCILAKPIFGC
jgi:hypothetical protein